MQELLVMWPVEVPERVHQRPLYRSYFWQIAMFVVVSLSACAVMVIVIGFHVGLDVGNPLAMPPYFKDLIGTSVSLSCAIDKMICGRGCCPLVGLLTAL